MTRERPRTVSVGVRGRGQTTQDFVVGIGIFVIAVAFVFTTVPDFIATQTASIDGDDTAQVERVAWTVINETETETPNELDGHVFARKYIDKDDLEEPLGLRATDDHRFDRVNITVRALDAGPDEEPLNVTVGVPGAGGPFAAGDEYDNEPAAQITRIVTVTNVDVGPDEPIDHEGEPVKLEVRMW
ncbi:DUF7287 family protein [Natrarchaeobius chitinivorans]|uniref:Uncharacterized protein n=1 Tax=Natrarchaeobius chitinivorans TaxID=1679083 RepID=A0A3N6LXI7_NATCH|nr:hypothetical protein [Natrarchaeobius chitinivorans]RQG92504.1 hypothetical protein EA473_15920 [Natrarchaeobius chitinivorans]